MTDFLAYKPRRRRTRDYIRSLPRRDRVIVSPSEFIVPELVPVIKVEPVIVQPRAGQQPGRKDRVRPRARLGAQASLAARKAATRAKLWTAQQGVCGSCGKLIEQAGDDSIDHVVPKARGGSDDIDNLLLMHRACNNAKADREPTHKERQRNRQKNERLAILI